MPDSRNAPQSALSKFFDHKSKQALISEMWSRYSIYKFDREAQVKDSSQFLIDTPPPTVSGMLHMGHVFSYVQTDIIARYRRMKGQNVFYPIGFDDNGLPTERLVEKLTKKKVGINCTKEEFVDECFKVVNEAELEFEKLFKSIGISYDWSLKYQTISSTTKQIAHSSFHDIQSKGLIYQKHAPVYWDVQDRTALAQADTEDKEMDSTECYIPFTSEKTKETIEVMTTRPEMLPACVAVLYHPDDTRYSSLSGTNLITPIFGEHVPFLPDADVSKDKGTGVVMCCTYGDWQDVNWTRKHSLKSKIIVSENGKIMSDYANVDNKQLSVADARSHIIQILKEQNLLLNEKPVLHAVKTGERSGKPVEIIETKQWYVSILPLKSHLLKLAHFIQFYPSHMQVRLIQWIENLNQDWCISRSRFFGVPIPVKDETDVLDTWFTSSLTPSLAWGMLTSCDHSPTETPAFSLRPQAHEIIRTWTFYTLVKTLLHAITLKNPSKTPTNPESFNPEDYFTFPAETEKQIPWHNVALSGWCLAGDKTKMSKSKGNIVTPVNIIEEYGADCIRAWCGSSTLGNDTCYSEQTMLTNRKFLTKLWNVMKFFSIKTSEEDVTLPQNADLKTISHPTDKWIISEFSETIQKYELQFQSFEYAKAKLALDHFFWRCLCDNYLEIIKVRSYGLGAHRYKDTPPSNRNEVIEGRVSCITTLQVVLEDLLRLYAPFMPFITEELYQDLFARKNAEHLSVHAKGSLAKIKSKYPHYSKESSEGRFILMSLDQSRKIKTSQNLSANAELETLEITIDQSLFPDIKSLDQISPRILEELKNVTNAKELKID